MKQVSCGCVVAVAAYVICTPLLAQESTSAALAKELVAALARRLTKTTHDTLCMK